MSALSLVLRALPALVLASMLLAGCQFDDSALGGAPCESDDDCPSGERCAAGRCVSADAFSVLDMDAADLPGDGADVPTGTPCGSAFCQTGESCCNDVCVDIVSNPDNCGACGLACAANEACVDGRCECGDSRCALTESCCATGGGPACTVLSLNTSNCGACGVTCETNELCVGGNCVCESTAGIQLCDEEQTCCGNQAGCRDLDSDPLHCGGCGVRCGPGELCQGGSCVCGSTVGANGSACGMNEACCGTPPSCVPSDDPICDCGGSDCATGELCCNFDLGEAGVVQACTFVAVDERHCGACGASCEEAETCVDGACQCQTGFADCDGNAANGCEVRLDSDPDHCGTCQNDCDPGFVCDGAASCELACQPGLTECNGVCVETDTDRANCGTCGTACDPGEICNGAGQCELSCQAGLTECGGVCVDTDTDRANCGTCGTPCGAGFVCNGAGQCELSCQPGLTECGGTCVETDTDRANCGTCGTACDPGEICNGAGTCALSCQAGLRVCSNECVNPLTDRRFCSSAGTCGVACDAGEVCVGGACQVSCPTGQVNCNGVCVDPQTDEGFCGVTSTCTGGAVCAANEVCTGGACGCEPGFADCGAAPGCETFAANDRAFCGANAACTTFDACGPGEVCANGVCALSCPPGQVNCAGTCIDPNTSRTFCGASGTCSGTSDGEICDPGEVCSAGVCALSCQAGLVNCGGTCVDPQTSRTFCGASGTCTGTADGEVCDPGEVCSAGVCRLSCQAGLVNCGGVCVDPNTSRTFCGASGTCSGTSDGEICDAGEVCSAGVCALSCQAGLVNCGGTCVDPQTSRTFCGASGTCTGTSDGEVCDPGEVCSAGVCALSCQAGLVNCGGVCVDPLTNRTFCGASGTCTGTSDGEVCDPGEICNGAGVCELSCQAGLIDCGGVCVDPDTNRTFCGASGTCTGTSDGEICDPGEVCSAGVCALSCQAGLIDCGGTCVDPDTNRMFCGATGACDTDATNGEVCGPGEICNGAGVCEASCQAGLTECSGTCVDTANDPDFCGDCTTVCTAPANATAVCAASSCEFVCDTGFGDCDGSAANGCETDLTSSEAHCGFCGNACANDDPCLSGTCTAMQTVFNAGLLVNGNLGGLAGADATCQAQAAAAGLSGTYKAWLSDSTTDAASRLTQATTPYALRNGTIVADNWTDLTDGTLDAPINLDENGATANIAAWTGTLIDGTSATDTCADWGSSGGGANGQVGRADSVVFEWTNYASVACNTNQSLYCIEQ